MGRCVFKTEEVLRCVEHALAAKNWSMAGAEDETPTPCLYFVHDQGVYVMSNGEPRDVISAEAASADRPTTYVVYAAHCDPARDTDWWQNSADLVGGDDFVEILPVTQQWLDDCAQYKEMYVEIKGTQLEAGFQKRRHTAVAAV
jgi:hypothetical protein